MLLPTDFNFSSRTLSRRHVTRSRIRITALQLEWQLHKLFYSALKIGATTSRTVPQRNSNTSRAADELCDDVLEHMLDCDRCLDGYEDVCATYHHLQVQIARQGGPMRALIFAFWLPWRADRDEVCFGNDERSVRADGAPGDTGRVCVAVSYASSGRRVLLHSGRRSSVRLRREVDEGWPGHLRLRTGRSPSWI